MKRWCAWWFTVVNVVVTYIGLKQNVMCVEKSQKKNLTTMNNEVQKELIPMTELCTRCGKKIDPETPIQIGDPLICDICTDDINTSMTEEQKDREEQQINKNDSKFMTITKFAWDEKANQVKTLQQQNKQLIEALEWYASNENWGTFEEYGIDIGDGGKHARTALQQIQGNK